MRFHSGGLDDSGAVPRRGACRRVERRRDFDAPGYTRNARRVEGGARAGAAPSRSSTSPSAEWPRSRHRHRCAALGTVLGADADRADTRDERWWMLKWNCSKASSATPGAHRSADRPERVRQSESGGSAGGENLGNEQSDGSATATPASANSGNRCDAECANLDRVCTCSPPRDPPASCAPIRSASCAHDPLTLVASVSRDCTTRKRRSDAPRSRLGHRTGRSALRSDAAVRDGKVARRRPRA